MNPHFGETPMSDPVQPVPRCQMCTEPPSGGIVRTVGDDDRLVDMGHPYCYGNLLAELHPIRRPARVQ